MSLYIHDTHPLVVHNNTKLMYRRSSSREYIPYAPPMSNIFNTK